MIECREQEIVKDGEFFIYIVVTVDGGKVNFRDIL